MLETAEVARWLYALGIGFLMFAGTLFLFILYRFTDVTFLAAVICSIVGVALVIVGFAVASFRTRDSGPSQETD